MCPSENVVDNSNDGLASYLRATTLQVVKSSGNMINVQRNR